MNVYMPLDRDTGILQRAYSLYEVDHFSLQLVFKPFPVHLAYNFAALGRSCRVPRFSWIAKPTPGLTKAVRCGLQCAQTKMRVSRLIWTEEQRFKATLNGAIIIDLLEVRLVCRSAATSKECQCVKFVVPCVFLQPDG